MGNHSGSFFRFSKGERNGIIVLFIIITGLLFIDLYVRNITSEQTWDYSEFKEEIEDFENSIAEAGKKRQNTNKQGRLSKNKSENKQEVELFYFDPNTISENKWKKLGLKQYQIRIIMNYREKGGSFEKPGDLKKIYGLDIETFNKLKDYIQIKKTEEKAFIDNKSFDENRKPKKVEKKIHKIDLNTADTIQLMLINGIGKVYANRICKYRELLRGYNEISQIREVYGINDSIYESIKVHFTVDTSELDKIDLNSADFSELIRHPYLNKYQTQSILKYREIKGKIKKVKELKRYNILSVETYNKMKNYMTCK